MELIDEGCAACNKPNDGLLHMSFDKVSGFFWISEHLLHIQYAFSADAVFFASHTGF